MENNKIVDIEKLREDKIEDSIKYLIEVMQEVAMSDKKLFDGYENFRSQLESVKDGMLEAGEDYLKTYRHFFVACNFIYTYGLEDQFREFIIDCIDSPYNYAVEGLLLELSRLEDSLNEKLVKNEH